MGNPTKSIVSLTMSFHRAKMKKLKLEEGRIEDLQSQLEKEKANSDKLLQALGNIKKHQEFVMSMPDKNVSRMSATYKMAEDAIKSHREGRGET